MPGYPDTLEQLLADFALITDRSERAEYLIELADRFRFPLISLIDTPGAYPGIEAEDAGRAAVRADERREHAEEGGLPRAVPPGDDERRAAGQREGDVDERPAPAVAAAHALGLDRRGAGGRSGRNGLRIRDLRRHAKRSFYPIGDNVRAAGRTRCSRSAVLA